MRTLEEEINYYNNLLELYGYTMYATDEGIRMKKDNEPPRLFKDPYGAFAFALNEIMGMNE